ncbi:hypothetical protein GCM10010486_32630 [Nonomuraea roseoviolacea subsp. carminata]
MERLRRGGARGQEREEEEGDEGEAFEHVDLLAEHRCRHVAELAHVTAWTVCAPRAARPPANPLNQPQMNPR